MPFPALPCPPLPCPALSCRVLPHHALLYPALSCAHFYHHTTLPCPGLPCIAIPYPVLFCAAVSCLTMPCPTLPCPAAWSALTCPWTVLSCKCNVWLRTTCTNLHVQPCAPGWLAGWLAGWLPGCELLRVATYLHPPCPASACPTATYVQVWSLPLPARGLHRPALQPATACNGWLYTT